MIKIVCSSFKNIMINYRIIFAIGLFLLKYFRINVVSFESVECWKKIKLIKIPSIDSNTTDESKEESQVLNIKYLRHCREIKIMWYLVSFFFFSFFRVLLNWTTLLFFFKVFQFSKERILWKMMRINNNRFTRIQRKIRKLFKKRNGTRLGQKWPKSHIEVKTEYTTGKSISFWKWKISRRCRIYRGIYFYFEIKYRTTNNHSVNTYSLT